MNWTKADADLRDVLAGLYYEKTDIRRIGVDIGLNPAHLNLDGKPVSCWLRVVEEAKKREKRDKLIQAALAEYPDNPALKALADGKQFHDVAGPDIHDTVDWRAEQSPDVLEKIIGQQNTILPISFFELGLEKARSVVRIELSDGKTGSGFLTDDNLIVTNHHVLKTAADAKTAKAQFNFQRNADGLDLPAEEFDFDPDQGFQTSKQDDWSLVRIRGDANQRWGAIPLKPASIAKNERVVIVQHPGGGPKSVALYHNIVTYADGSRVQYLTDTQPGSSGSPVFDSQFNLVAIHHSGGWLREPGSKKPLFRNEGIAVECILEKRTI